MINKTVCFLFLFWNLLLLSQESPYAMCHIIVEGDSISFEYSKSIKSELNLYLKNLDRYEIDKTRFKDLGGLYHSNAVDYYSRNAIGVTLLQKDFKDFVFISTRIPSYIPSLISATFHHEMYHFMLNRREHPTMESGAPYILIEGKDVDPEIVICGWGEPQSREEYFNYIKKEIEN